MKKSLHHTWITQALKSNKRCLRCGIIRQKVSEKLEGVWRTKDVFILNGVVLPENPGCIKEWSNAYYF